MSLRAFALSLVTLLVAGLALSAGGFNYTLTNGTIMVSEGAAYVASSNVILIGLNLSPGPLRESVEQYPKGLLVALFEQGPVNASIVNVTFISSPLGGYAADVELYVNTSNVTLLGVWQGPQYRPAGALPGMSEALVQVNGSRVEIYGSSPEFQALTYFTSSSWVNFVLGGDGWTINLVAGQLPPARNTTTNTSLPPPAVLVPGRPSAASIDAVLTEGQALPLLMILISAASLALAAVAERDN